MLGGRSTSTTWVGARRPTYAVGDAAGTRLIATTDPSTRRASAHPTSARRGASRSMSNMPQAPLPETGSAGGGVLCSGADVTRRGVQLARRRAVPCGPRTDAAHELAVRVVRARTGIDPGRDHAAHSRAPSRTTDRGHP